MADRMTTRQRQVYDLRHSQNPPLSYSEVARRLGITKGNASKSYYREVARLETRGEPRGVRSDAVEVKDPEYAAAAIDGLTDPLETIRGMCRKTGMPPATAAALMKRLETRYLPVKQEVEKVKTEVLLDLFGSTAKRIMASISPEDIDEAKLRDKAVAAGIFTDKTLLHQGQPTQVYSVKELESLEELSRMMVAEARRRGSRILPLKPPGPAELDPTE